MIFTLYSYVDLRNLINKCTALINLLSSTILRNNYTILY